MKTTYFLLATALCYLAVACDSNKKEKEQPKLYEPTAEVPSVSPEQRGELLVNIIGCNDCHSPKKMTDAGFVLDQDRLLSGHPAEEKLMNYDMETSKAYVLFSMGFTAAVGPWGTSFSANITPDDTGIGSWTEAQFLNAIKKGKYKGLDDSRQLLPPMPWQSYSNLPDDDLKAIFAYLKSIKPVKNIVPSPIPPRA